MKWEEVNKPVGSNWELNPGHPGLSCQYSPAELWQPNNRHPLSTRSLATRLLCHITKPPPTPPRFSLSFGSGRIQGCTWTYFWKHTSNGDFIYNYFSLCSCCLLHMFHTTLTRMVTASPTKGRRQKNCHDSQCLCTRGSNRSCRKCTLHTGILHNTVLQDIQIVLYILYCSSDVL